METIYRKVTVQNAQQFEDGKYYHFIDEFNCIRRDKFFEDRDFDIY